jgi:hypothetical protein
MILRCTAKMRTLLRVRQPVDTEPTAQDWYANLLWHDGRKCVLLTHAGTLFPIFAPDIRGAQLRPLRRWLSDRISGELDAESLPLDILGAMDPDGDVDIAKTASRHVLGVMNDIALHLDYAIPAEGGLAGCDITSINYALRRILHQRDGRYVTTLDLIEAHHHR